jgi:hypothetical protein
MKKLTLSDAIIRQYELSELPAGFSAIKSQVTKYWDIYFKYTPVSQAEIIQSVPTEKQAINKVAQFNVILAGK